VVDLTKGQKHVLDTDGHQLVVGGPGSGKTTVSILNAAQIARESLRAEQTILFLSFARATVSRVVEAIDEERQITRSEKRRIEVDTYHSFFWRLLKSHGYLVGLPRKISVLAPPAEAIALSTIRNQFGPSAKLSAAELIEKQDLENGERLRLAYDEGQVCFDLFANKVGMLLHGSERIRGLTGTMYPVVILDEFQDTSAAQWKVVEALGENSTLLALADPEQRIFDFIGADPERLDHFKAAFAPTVHDLSTDNHRSKGTEIAIFGNDILTGKFRQKEYTGIDFHGFESNPNQAYSSLVTQTLQARARLLKTGRRDWSLAILVPTKRMTRIVSDLFREPLGGLPTIAHTAAVDMEGPILAAEIIAFFLQQGSGPEHFSMFVDLLCNFFHGRGGGKPGKGNMAEATRIRAAAAKWLECMAVGKAIPKNSILIAAYDACVLASQIALTGDPDSDWIAIRAVTEQSTCPRMKEITNEVRNVRLLERGTQLRHGLAQDWRDFGAYRNALSITRQSFTQEHFANANKPEAGVIVMNMHKAKGKQFDEVIIFEGWPKKAQGKIVANPDRIVRSNIVDGAMVQARQNFRVSVTRAKSRTTIMTPSADICVLLRPA
jgi:DNA helicase-2/ATP-dependent DNA helicase PcrA